MVDYWVPNLDLDKILNEIALADEEVICNAFPTTYFNACHPDLWLVDAPVVVGDLVRPPTTNGYIYECTVGGTTGSTEPAWGTAQDAMFDDNGVTWKTHANFALSNTFLTSEDKAISAGVPDGRKLTIAEITGVVTHTGGIVSHTALISNATRKLHLVTAAETTDPGDNFIVSGRTTIFHALEITSKVKIP